MAAALEAGGAAPSAAAGAAVVVGDTEAAVVPGAAVAAVEPGDCPSAVEVVDRAGPTVASGVECEHAARSTNDAAAAKPRVQAARRILVF